MQMNLIYAGMFSSKKGKIWLVALSVFTGILTVYTGILSVCTATLTVCTGILTV